MKVNGTKLQEDEDNFCYDLGYKESLLNKSNDVDLKAVNNQEDSKHTTVALQIKQPLNSANYYVLPQGA